jgi:hypothetical protein
MTDLRAFILKRQAQIETESKPIWMRFMALKTEMDELRPKMETYRKEWAELDTALKAIGGAQKKVEEAAQPDEPTLTIKEAILAVLAKQPNGLLSPAILEAINKEYFGGRIARTSFSPQLSRLKSDGDILLRGIHYVLNPQKHIVTEPEPSLFQRRF